MASDPTLPPVIGAIADASDGSALGTVTAVFLDDQTNQPTWVGITDGLHAAADGADDPVVAPVQGAEFGDGRLRLRVSAEAVRTSPRPGSAEHLSPADERLLLEHYAGGRHAAATDGPAAGGPAAGSPGVAAGPAAGGTDDAMTVSEERLSVDTVVEPWTRAVLTVEEVTEEVMVPVTVTRQRVRVDHLPLRPGTDGGALPTAASRSGQVGEWVTLYSEQPVVSVERRPTERVRLATSWTTEQHTVTEQVRREEVALDRDVPTV